jgi:hypothetical protein
VNNKSKSNLTSFRNFNWVAIIRFLFGWIAVGLLTSVFTYFVINGFQLSPRLYGSISSVFIIILGIIYLFKPQILYVINAVLIAAIGIFVIFLSGNQEIRQQITWDPGLLGAGVSIVAMAISFFTYMFPPKMQNANKRQVSKKEYRNLENSISKLGSDISFIKNNISGLNKTSKVILKKIENIKFKVTVQKGKK